MDLSKDTFKKYKDNKDQRFLNALYFFGVINVPKKEWLSPTERRVYATMLKFVMDGGETSRGWIANLTGDRVSKLNRWTYVSRISTSELWFKVEKEKYIFPKAIVDMYKAISRGEEINYNIKI